MDIWQYWLLVALLLVLTVGNIYWMTKAARKVSAHNELYRSAKNAFNYFMSRDFDYKSDHYARLLNGIYNAVQEIDSLRD